MQPLNDFLNAALHFGFTMLLKKIDKRKEENETFLGKKQKKKQCYHNDNCRWKGKVFPEKLNLEDNLFE